MADPDTTNPTLTSASLPSVNVTGGGQTVTFSVGALDTGSGVDRVYLYFDHGWQGQSGLQSVVALSDGVDSFADGTSAVSVYFDPASAGGTYSITSAMVYDKAGNWTQYSPADLTALGIPSSFDVTSNAAPDTTPPALTSLVLSNVDVSGGGATAAFTASASDQGSGVDRVILYFDRNWAGQTSFSGVVTFSNSQDPFADGSSAVQVYFDPATPAGTYSVTSAIVYDLAGNFAQYSTAQLVSLGLSTSFTVTSNTPADTTPPAILSSTMPAVHLSASGATVSFSVTASDGGTGVDRVIFYFDHGWSGQSGLENSIQFSDAAESFSDQLSAKAVFFDPGTVPGIYSVTSAIAFDRAGNWVQYSPAELASAGLQTSFAVLGRAPIHNDFNGDGISDVLWRNGSDTLTDWLGTTNGALSDNSTQALSGTLESGWQVAATGDFNGDGRTDILFRNGVGSTTDWLGNSDGRFADNSAQALTAAAGVGWTMVGSGDFNGDGMSDLLWRNGSSGYLTEWLGSTAGAFHDNSANAASGAADNSWQVAGTGDFNADGISDVLWRNVSGYLTEWLGTPSGKFTDNAASAATGAADNSWLIVGTGDFNGDGHADILWRHTSGYVTEWLGGTNGGFTDNAGAAATGAADNSWQIVSIGDFNGDGKDDLLWRNVGSGYTTEWLGTGTGGFTDNAAIAATGAADNSWHVQDPMF